jgi:uncharacterized protein
MSRIDVVSQVAFYPLKGGRAATVEGEVPQSLAVGQTGFEVHGIRDRDFVLFDPNEGAFVSQRGWGATGKKIWYPQDRRLATVQMDVRADHVAVSSAVGHLELPATPTEGDSRTLEIFGKQLPAVKQGADPANYFSRLLKREVWLMRSDRGQPRVLPDRYQREGAFNQVAAADGMPFLLVSQASLTEAHAANDMAPETVPIDRYRGNVVIDGNGLEPFGEDYIDPEAKFSIGEIGLWVVKACSRCPIPEIDQQSGELAGGALRVLRGRAGEIFTGEKGVFFGQNMVHANTGVIAVGDVVAVETMSPTPNIEFRNAV